MLIFCLLPALWAQATTPGKSKNKTSIDNAEFVHRCEVKIDTKGDLIFWIKTDFVFKIVIFE